MQVIGMGETKTPTAFISACNQFKYLDKLFEDKQTTEEPAADNEVEKINNTIKSIIENFSDDDGWIFSGRLGDQLSKRLPDFDKSQSAERFLFPCSNLIYILHNHDHPDLCQLIQTYNTQNLLLSIFTPFVVPIIK